MPLIQGDFSQIEIYMAADQSGDQTLIQLLNEGKDVHRWSASNVLEKPEEEVTDSERKPAKRINFGILYGNGAGTASKNTGRDILWCKNYISRFYELFPGIKQWQDRNIKIVEATGRLRMFTGMVLKFRKYPATKPWEINKGLKEVYSTTEIKNYPVQHTAWIIISLFLGDFFRDYAIHNRDKYLMVNTVHDSLILDCKPEYVNLAKQHIQECVDRLPARVLELWGRKLLVPIKMDITVADSWAEMENE